MQVHIDVAAHYEWEPATDVPTDPAALEAALVAMQLKPAANSTGYLQKVILERETHTSVAIPETQIESLLKHHQSKGVAKTRASVVATLLEETVMPHHAHPTHFKKISVLDEPDVEKFLSMYFNCPGEM